MTLTLLVLAMVPAANPFRALAARPDGRRAAPLALALAATVVGGLAAALVSGPLLDLVDVSGPNARIAAGIALLAVTAKDLFARPPSPEPALPGTLAGLVPLAFPVLFSPALALLAVAGASERGVAVAVGAVALSLVPAAIVLAAPGRRGARLGTATVGAAGAGIAALVVLDGVYAI
jgi:small neutral amino acid transporter SnatA (MarC family)